MHRLDWSDLQFILAVANQGSLAGAARALGVNHSTVQRRITSFEALQQVTVFDRKPDGYKLTIEGQQLLEAAKAVWGDTVDNRQFLHVSTDEVYGSLAPDEAPFD